MSNSEGSQYDETDQWDLEETIGDKISDENAFRWIMEPYRFDPHVSNSDQEGDNGGVKMETPVVFSLHIGRFCFFIQLAVYKGFCINW